MNLFRIAMFVLSIGTYLIFAQETQNAQPQISIQESKYISFKSTDVKSSNNTVSFVGTFVILGKGVFGHFDMVAFDDSGKKIQVSTSDNQNWRKDQGGKLKTIKLFLSNCQPVKVEVSFHEMRVNPDAGACKP